MIREVCMRRSRLWFGASLSAALMAASFGCSETPAVNSSNAEATVSGKVTIKGKPMKGGEITFNPANYQRQDAPTRTAPVKPDGTYEITTLQGQNAVKVAGPEVLKDPQLGYAGLTVDVPSGGKTFDIELPPPK
jgi:hypothetical protein